MNYSQTRGRRPGKPDTRAEILRVAEPMFLANGYEGVTLRAIADAAGVDVALISYFFGSKKGVFGATMRLAVNPAELLAKQLEGELSTFPQRALHSAITVWDSGDAGGPLIALIRSAAVDPAVATVVREVVEREMIDKIAERLGGRDARRRAGAFASQMVGLIYSRYVVAVEPVASMPVDELVRLYAPALAAALGLVARPRVPGPAR